MKSICFVVTPDTLNISSLGKILEEIERQSQWIGKEKDLAQVQGIEEFDARTMYITTLQAEILRRFQSLESELGSTQKELRDARGELAANDES